ncbi:cilia- and flagella-associated protein 107 [Boleophthalmus pectinirostris]|uniref:cilia- and flagella-associated protein 107 n=1 Tax=Boleophthalmus pectinirostris TaxID=150288 RepID=UPI00242B72C7|nr:cilia- and flagella-associated protein 107 [Boleophthalmus pectinirostris]
MYLTRAAQDKWSQPGWRIENKYTNKVLLGNWAEERQQFKREPRLTTAPCSTSRADYTPHWDVKPDSFERRSGLQRTEGLPAKLLFAQQGSPSSHGLVTHYEESYGRKRTNALPTLQPCHQKSSTWALHRPNTAFPNYSSSLQLQRAHVDRVESQVPCLTVYRSAYQRHPHSAFCQSRFARASYWTSSYLHRANHLNKDLDLRQAPLRQVPDQCVRLLQSAQHA